jgi:hypothetical protein
MYMYQALNGAMTIVFIALIIGLAQPKLFNGLFKRKVTRRFVLTSFGGLFLLMGVTLVVIEPKSVRDGNLSANKPAQPAIGTSTPKPTTKATQAPTAPPLTYQTIKTWDINNGGHGKVIVIDPALFINKQMKLVADKVKNDTVSDRNAFVYVFTDTRSANYDARFVGAYTKNANTGLNEFAIYYDGAESGSSETVKY